MLGRAVAYALIAGGVSALQRLWSASSGATMLITIAVGVGATMTFVIRTGIAMSRDKQRYQQEWLLIQPTIMFGAMLILASAYGAAPGGLRKIAALLPVVISMTLLFPGIMLAISGLPSRLGTQRVCKFCEYEYTFGYPPESDLSAPPRCPECGKGWLGDLAVGVKRSRPGRVAAGTALAATALLFFGLIFFNARAVNLLPTRAQQALALSHNSAASAAWDALQPALANYTPQQHLDLFTALLDKRREQWWRFGPSQHAYMLQQWPAMPATLQERFYREMVEIRVHEKASPATGRMHIAIATRHLASVNAQTLLRIMSVTAGDAPQMFALEEAWPGMTDANHYFAPVAQERAEDLVISIPATTSTVTVRLRMAVMHQFGNTRSLQTNDPPSAAWIQEFDFPVERRKEGGAPAGGGKPGGFGGGRGGFGKEKIQGRSIEEITKETSALRRQREKFKQFQFKGGLG